MMLHAFLDRDDSSRRCPYEAHDTDACRERGSDKGWICNGADVAAEITVNKRRYANRHNRYQDTNVAYHGRVRQEPVTAI